MAKNLLDLIDIDLLAYYKSKEDLVISGKVDKVDGKGLSSNDYTSNEKTKLAGIASGAQVNTIEGIQVTGTSISPVNKIVNIPAATQSAAGVMSATDKTKIDGVATGAQVNVLESVKVNGITLPIRDKYVNIGVPTKVSDIDNDSGFITIADVPEGAAGTTTTPKMDGTAAVGTETAFARGDHVHPHDSTKVDVVDGMGLSHNDYTDAEKTKLSGIAAGAQVNVVTNASSTGSGAGQTMTVSKGSTDYTTYTKDAINAISQTLITSINGKVDAVDGMGLSHNDYTDAEKTKLSGIAAGAQVNVVTNASSTGSGAAQTMTVSKGSTNFVTYTKDALDTSLGLKANASSVYTKTEIDQKLVGAMNYKGTKATTSALPSSGNAQGDVWHITADGSEWAWNGEAWEELGTALDLSGYVEESEIGLATNADIDALFT